jgi:hypothetical protein
MCALPLALTAAVSSAGCGRDAGEARTVSSSSSAVAAPPTSAVLPAPVEDASWPTDIDERDLLLRLRSHYRMVARAARVMLEAPSSDAVRDEASWLVKIYEHMSEHFEVSLREWYGPAEAAAPDPALHEFTDPSTIRDVRAREHRFAEEMVRTHQRLLAFVRSPTYDRYAVHRPLLREIRVDVETSEATQVAAFEDAVLASGAPSTMGATPPNPRSRLSKTAGSPGAP